MEKRQTQRFTVERLPAGLRVFFINFGPGFDEYHGEVYDASEEGLCLFVSCPAEEMKEDRTVVIKNSSGDIRLIARIVHIAPYGDYSCRVGLQFQKAKSLERYRNLIRNVL